MIRRRPVETVFESKGLRRLFVAVSLSLVLAACRSDGGEPIPADDGGGTIVLGVPAAATTPLPPFAAAALDFELGGAAFLALNYGEWEDGGLRYRPGHVLGLARSWEQSGTDLTYRLETTRRWSDGAPITSADVAFTFGLLADTTLALPLASVTARLDSISTPDDSTATFHFNAEYPGMLFDTGIGLLPAHFFGQIDRGQLLGGFPLPEGQAASDVPVSGPFRIGEWRPTERVVFHRNDVAAKPSRLERLVVRVLPDEVAREAELRSGGIQVAAFNSFRVARRLAQSGMTLDGIPQRGFDYIGWNPAAHPALGDPSVRKALSLAIDRDAIIAALDLDGHAEPAWGPYGSLFSGLRAPPPHRPLFDPVEAARLLDAAGWTAAGDADVMRTKEGTRLAFDLAVPSGNDRREDAAEIIQSQLADLGVDVRITSLEFNALFSRLLSLDYEAALMGWQVALDPDISPFWGDAAPLNVVAFDHPPVHAAVASALAQSSYESAAPFWRTAGQEIAAEYPYAFLWFFDVPLVYAASVEGIHLSALGWGPGLADWRRIP